MFDNEVKVVVYLPGVEKELKSLPVSKGVSFVHNINSLSKCVDPVLKVKPLSEAIEPGVFELVINGSPAFRCIYYTKEPGEVVVLRAFKKTTNGPAKSDYAVAKKRLSLYKKSRNK